MKISRWIMTAAVAIAIAGCASMESDQKAEYPASAGHTGGGCH